MLPHTIITASAGSGKTWSLTVRYLRLLMLGAPPESIVALTFSRKAAGEFFNAILHRLAEAAAGDLAAEVLARDIKRPGTTRGEFCQALERMIARLPFLMMGTLDSFFIRMARSFPFELGLAGDFTILDPHQQAVEKLRVYERVFAASPGRATERHEFMRAFSEATHGKDEVKVRSKLDEFVKAWHSLYLAAPFAAQWGDAGTIWPQKPPVPGPPGERAEMIERIRTGLARMDWKEKHQERWDVFLAAAESYLPGSPVSTSPIKYLWDRLLPLLPALKTGQAILKMDRTTYDLEGPLAEAVLDLCRHLIAGALQVVLRQTRGIYEVIRHYDRSYHELVRRQGRLTFHDVQLILGGGLSPEASGGDAVEVRSLTHGGNRQLMDYRLDARYDHWLLDEFQDTSRVQWQVLANLIDEAVQDSEGIKSFFAVGDQKQSIYEWRGGTPQLFDELHQQYNSGVAREEDYPLKIEPLSVSQRSGPAVIGMVNALLGNLEALAEVLPPAAVAAWPWQEHTSRNTHYGGAAMVIEVPNDAGDEPPAFDESGESADQEEVPDGDARWRRAAELLLELQPLKRGLTCAVLCHRNPRALALADFLRSATKMEVVCESDLSIARDNPATSALLSLLKAAAHPGDIFAWRHVMMTPLARIMEKSFPDPSAQTATSRMQALRGPGLAMVRGQVVETGFHNTFRWWTEALERQMPELDQFSRGRLDELCGCAREFDSTGSRDVDEFLTFADSWTVRGESHAGAVQVMTVHRSKGLTFDIVIMPDLHDGKMFRHGQTVGMQTDAAGSVKWLLKLPGKDVAMSDPVLAEAMERAHAATWRERMAGLYVMVTRAKYANYLFLSPGPKKDTTTPSLAGTVRHLLTGPGAGELSLAGISYPVLAGFGDHGWIQKHLPLSPVAASRPEAVAGVLLIQNDLFAPSLAAPAALVSSPEIVRKGVPLRRRRPSDRMETGDGGLFQNHRQAARDTGIAVHEALRRVVWSADAAAALAGPGLDPAAAAEALACVIAPALTEFFTQPAGPSEVWRERAFEMVMEGTWHSGVFDRVIFHRSDDGRVESAVLVDFKTERPQPSAKEAALAHHGQLTKYRLALSRLSAVPLERIRAVVLFTSTHEAVDL